MDDLLRLALGKLADHYQVSEDDLRRMLLLRGVAELNAVTDMAKHATADDLQGALTNLNQRLEAVVEGLRQQVVQVDNAVQNAGMAIAMIERMTTILHKEAEALPLKSSR